MTSIALERISVYEDLRTMIRGGEFDFFFVSPDIEAAKIVEKKTTVADTKRHLEHVLSTLESLDTCTPESLKNALWDYATVEGRGSVLWPLRYALSGKERSPDPFVIAGVIGKEETTKRVRHAIAALQ